MLPVFERGTGRGTASIKGLLVVRDGVKVCPIETIETSQMPTVLIAVGTIAGLKLAKYVWSIIWEWA